MTVSVPAPFRLLSRADLWGLLLLLLAQAGCSLRPTDPEPQSASPVPPASPSLLVLHHSGDSDGRMCYQHVRQTLSYTKLPYDSINLSTDSLPPLDDYRTVVTTTERLGALSMPDARRLLRFVEEGGGLAVLFRGWHPILGPLFGRPTTFDPEYTLVPNERLELHGRLMPGAGGLTLDSLSLSMLDVAAADTSLSPGTTVLATARRSGRPAAWYTPYGNGRTVFWNVGQLTSKSFRGAIIQSIAAVQPFSVRPLANWAALYLDDFPSPAVSTMMDPIASEFGLSAAEFYATRWYPDMRRLADEFGLTYTSTVTFSYNGSVRPPYRFQEWLNGRIALNGEVVYYSPWIARRDAHYSEMAFHGYNHQPLRRANWPSFAHMTKALTAARHRWHVDDLGPPPTTYVPPMNRIDSTGMQALTEIFPSLNVVAGLYGGTYALGQDREFGPDPWTDSLYALPRNTSGYILSDPLRLSMISLLEVLGAWGHFVHPDEVYPNEDRYESMRELGISIPDGGFQWYGESAQDGLYYQFREWLQFAHTQYPWLRYRTAQGAVSIMKNYDDLSWRWEEATDGAIRIRTSQTPSFFVAHAPAGIGPPDIRGGDLLQRTDTDLLTKFVVRATAPTITLQFADSPHVASHAPSF